jgi:hypothetical protein
MEREGIQGIEVSLIHFVGTTTIHETSVATVITNVFQKNEINLLRKFAKIMIISDKIDDSKNQGVI